MKTAVYRAGIFLIFLLFFSASHGFARQADRALSGSEVVASADGIEITVDEFIRRYEFMPWPGKEIKGGQPRLKREVLHALLAEKLLALEAVELGLDRDKQVRFSIDEVERLLVLDALYREEIWDKAQPGPAAIDSAVAKAHASVTFAYREHASRDAAEQFRSAVEAGPSQPDFPDTLTVAWAELAPPMAEAFRENLHPGAHFGPISLGGGWYTVRLIDIIEPVTVDPRERFIQESAARNRLLQQNTDALFEHFIADFSAGRSVEIDGEVLALLVDEIRAAVGRMIGLLDAYGREDYFPLTLSPQNYAAFKNRLATHLDRPLIFGEAFELSLGYVMNRIAFKSFNVEHAGQDLERVLHRLVRRIIQEEFLIREGYARGLHRKTSVMRDVGLWKDAYLALHRTRAFADDADLPDDAETVFEVNIREVVVPQREKADSLRALVEGDGDLAGLARRYSVREWAAEQGGEFGYFLTNEFGPIGSTSARMEIGELAGPIETAEGWSIFKLIDKRLPLTAEEAGSGRRAVLDSLLNAHVAEQAAARGYFIDYELLDRVEVVSQNQVVIRNLGFNNQMPAAPATRRLFQWPALVDSSPRPGT